MPTVGTRNAITKAELALDLVVRSAFPCPVCNALLGARCIYTRHPSSMTMSHTGRYDLAASAGLVRAIPTTPGRGVAVLIYQSVPNRTWTAVNGVTAEVFQDSGASQSMIIENRRMRWLDSHRFPHTVSILLRPPGGVYPPGWVAPLSGAWWVSEAIPIGEAH